MSKFDPNTKMIKMQGKDYLPVNWRIVWFREDHPKGSIVTELAGEGLIKATVVDGEGKVLATGHGSPKLQGVAKARPFEGAETAAIGRALAHAGYGTQFTDEDEGEHLADSPVERVDPEIVTNELWENWMKIVKRAEAVKIPHADFVRADAKASEIKAAGKELQEIVKNAEAQAKAGA